VRTRVAQLLDRSVRYLEAGSGQPLILLHAFPLSADQWLPQLARPEPGWRVIAPDFRGFRGSGPAFAGPPLDGMTIDRHAQDTFELMTHLEIDRATIGGLSMGGYVALAMVRQKPDRVSGLILSNTRATADTPEGREGRARMLARIAADGPAGVAHDMLPKLLSAATHRDQPDLVETVRGLIEMNSAEGLASAVAALRDRPDATPTLGTIACKTTVICGSEDTITPVSDGEAMARAIPGARLIVIPGAAHLSNLEGQWWV
jgi:pimeloyl-ACP methyl ester carboxylesterase